jgi:hypothetical protein
MRGKVTDLEYILNDEGKFNEGIYVNPSWVEEGRQEDEYKWKLYTVDGAVKRLKQLQRAKGRKRLSILLQFNDHLSDWHPVTWPILFEMIKHRESSFRNCTVKQLYYIKGDLERYNQISIWPASVRNENENKENNWGKENNRGEEE